MFEDGRGKSEGKRAESQLLMWLRAVKMLGKDVKIVEMAKDG